LNKRIEFYGRSIHVVAFFFERPVVEIVDRDHRSPASIIDAWCRIDRRASSAHVHAHHAQREGIVRMRTTAASHVMMMTAALDARLRHGRCDVHASP
jgi:hypothetical protein